MENCECLAQFSDGYKKGIEAERQRIIEVMKSPVQSRTGRTFLVTLSEEQLQSIYGVEPTKATRKLRLVQ